MTDAAGHPNAALTTQDTAGSRFYLRLSAWMWALAIGGFGPGLVEQLADGSWTSMPVVVHLHAIVYFGWLALYSYQVSLPAAGQTGRHRQLGKFLVGYAGLMIVMGVTVMMVRFADRVAEGQAELASAILIHPLTDMLVFPVLFGLAVHYRTVPTAHKRLMVVATTMLLIAAVGRMKFLGDPPSVLVYDVVWLSPIWIAMIRDVVVHRRLHPAYATSLLALSILPLRTLLVSTGPYQSLTHWLSGVF